MSDPIEEERWVEAARGGDQDAFWQLVERHGPMVHRLLIRLVRDRDKAEDLFSETFLRARDKISGFRGDAQFSTWLVTIALNRAKNQLKRGQRRKNISWDEVIPGEAHRHGDGAPSLAEWANPHEALERKELRALLDAALTELPTKYRVVFTLRDIEGLSTEETAQMLGLTQTAVKSRAVRARLAMRKFLAPYFTEPKGVALRA
jgi:RNA polymerase sigma-70 factor (ECF subfamily)